MRPKTSTVQLFLVTGVLFFAGYAGPGHAISQGEPGEALLIPYVLFDSDRQVNTLVTITTAATLGVDPTQIERGGAAFAGSGFTTAAQEGASDCDLAGAPDGTGATGSLSWWFFDDIGVIRDEGTLAIGCDQFMLINWGALVSGSGATELDGMPGFMVVANTSASTAAGDPEIAMYGDAMYIRSDGRSTTSVPVLPLTDSSGNSGLLQGSNEIVYAGGQPLEYSPLSAGIGLDNDNGVVDGIVRFDMPYALLPGINGSTEMVVWLDRNCRGGIDLCDRRNVPIRTFDAERNSIEGVINLSRMLNLVDPASLARPGNAGVGFVRVDMPEVADDNTAGFEGPDHAGVAFAFITFGNPDTAMHTQTFIGHDRGVK